VTDDDAKLKDIEDRKRELCSDFRRRLTRLLNEERRVLGLIEHDKDEIEIYY
jgi:hypothetical protein